MGNQHETLIPSRLDYITSLSHETNNTQPGLTLGFNASIYDNSIDYL